MATTKDEFEFDETDLNLDDQALADMDKEFLKGIQEKTDDVATDEANNAFTFWFLIILLLLFVFFLSMGVIMLVKGRRQRYEYMLVGYR
jgi:hypothetical protein